jgi:hypothetical protein
MAFQVQEADRWIDAADLVVLRALADLRGEDREVLEHILALHGPARQRLALAIIVDVV